MTIEQDDLKKFQKEALSKLESAFDANTSKDIIFHSCTGSGKTIVLSYFIKNLMDNKKNLVFIWLTPGTGDLEIQSQKKYEKYVRNAETKQLRDIMISGFEENDVCFINWELINKAGNLAISESENKNLLEHLAAAHSNGYEFVVIVDEEHVNKTNKSANILSLIKPKQVIRASATPKNVGNSLVIKVAEKDVIRDGLIKKVLFINEGIESNLNITNQIEYLIDKARDKQKNLREEYIKKDIQVNPLIIIQVPNDSDALISQVEQYLESQGITYDNKKLAVRLADKKENLDNIEDNMAEPIVIIIKQAVAVGWDCPRAQILVKLRENMDESFEIQTIGRIRRMPQAVHYENRLLDACYLYTFDKKFTEGVKLALGKSALNSKTLKLKSEYRDFVLTQEKKASLRDSLNINAARNTFKKYYERTYSTKTNKKENQKILGIHGYKFEEDIIISTKQGDINTLTGSDLNELNTLQAIEKINPRRHSKDFHRSVNKIATSIGMNYDAMLKIIRSLFLESSTYSAKILSLNTLNLYAFVINNTDKIKEDVIAANSDYDLQEQLDIVEINEIEFKFPEEFIFTYTDMVDSEIYRKNIYFNYDSSAAPRSDGEKLFELFCEGNSDVNYVFKNGDNGAGYFSIIYIDNMMKHRLFYPDYIVGTDSGVFIFEVKGAQTSSGQSENIDKYTAHKDAALKTYLKKHNLKGGIVRLNKKNMKLYVCIGKYDEDMNSGAWRDLTTYIREVN
ncbi:DEAD/DEAH box helicase [Bacillus thuringiensis]|uniref:DEAD/DEAH box helicase n=1 Tax=Bacillus thuringiensis TaxID=1428 RepID=UPI000BED9812|nr:DEAD/DEAH box helicase family protein [Bacillus thuringiensis]PEF07907.1 restriction endonuclease subunit R [Bacillus thuringiensis]